MRLQLKLLVEAEKSIKKHFVVMFFLYHFIILCIMQFFYCENFMKTIEIKIAKLMNEIIKFVGEFEKEQLNLEYVKSETQCTIDFCFHFFNNIYSINR